MSKSKQRNKTEEKILKEFSKLVLKNFSVILNKHGFQLVRNRIDNYFCEIVYANNMLYVSFEADMNPRDYPPYFNILLGEGLIEEPDRDWNAVALWRFAKSEKKESAPGEYLLKDISMLKDSLRKAKKDFMKHGKSFLCGDLSSFYQIRKNINKDRKPYEISYRNKEGFFVKKIDRESVRMKEKYS